MDIAEIAATPALIQACVKGVEKEGQAEFKVFGKKHTLSMNKPTEKPSATRPPESSHSSAKTSSSCPRQPNRGLEKRAPKCDDKTYVTVTTKISDEPGVKEKFACTYAGGGKVCTWKYIYPRPS